MNPTKIHLRRLEDEYDIIKGSVLGEGAYGKVYKATRGDQIYAIKEMHAQGEGGGYKLVTSNASLREIKLLRELSHRNIVTLRDQFLNLQDMSLSLVYDFAKTDLRKVIWEHKRTRRGMNPSVIRAFMFQLLQGVQYLHENWVLHRDLKPENILIEKPLSECQVKPSSGAGAAAGAGSGPIDCEDFMPGVPWLKICDFGLARIFQSPVRPLSDVERVVATLWYRAPELLLGSRHYATAVDVWAVGCIFAEMFNRQQLFPGDEVRGKGAPFQKAQCEIIFNVLGVPKESRWPGVSNLPHWKHVMGWGSGFPSDSILRKMVPTMKDEHALNLLSRLLELDPAKRISAAEALQHDYFRPLRELKMNSANVDRPLRRPIPGSAMATAAQAATALAAHGSAAAGSSTSLPPSASQRPAKRQRTKPPPSR